MTTTISPSLGHAPLWTQAGTGASPGYDAIDRRRADGMGFQEGVFGSASCEVVQRAAGANMSVDITTNVADALGSGLMALVQGDAVTHQGLYPVPPHTAVINETVTTAHATLPRVDQVVLEVLDNTHDSSGSNLVRTRVVAGTATSGATLANRTGAAALPSSALLLADVLVGAAATSITNAVIRDRRKWARGAFCRLAHTSSNISISATSFTQVSSALAGRIECSGSPLRMSISGWWLAGALSGGAATAYIRPVMDGAPIDGASSTEGYRGVNWVTSAESGLLHVEYTFTPSAGSHTFDWQAAVTGSDEIQFVTNAGTGQPLVAVIEEILRQNTKNNSTTTG